MIAGERLCEGSVNPHDILKISGEGAVHTYMLNEIQEVYRLHYASDRSCSRCQIIFSQAARSDLMKVVRDPSQVYGQV